MEGGTKAVTGVIGNKITGRGKSRHKNGPERSLGLLRDGQKGWSRLKEG